MAENYATYIGIGFPLRASGEHGFIELKSDKILINDSILQIIMTRKGERVMLPEFGCDIRNYLFNWHNPAIKQLIAYEIWIAIEQWEARVTVTELNFTESEMEKEDGIVRIEVKYKIISSGEVDSVYIDYDKNGRLVNVNN